MCHKNVSTDREQNLLNNAVKINLKNLLRAINYLIKNNNPNL